MTDPKAIAAKLTKAQREALIRLCNRMIWADGRSVAALERRELVEVHASGVDAMIGDYRIILPTPLGLAVRAILENEQ